MTEVLESEPIEDAILELDAELPARTVTEYIEDTLKLIDQGLSDFGGYNVVTASDVTDLLLDARGLLIGAISSPESSN